MKQKAYKLIFNPSAGYGRKRFTWLNRCLSKNKAPTNNDQTLTLIKKIFEANNQRLDISIIDPSASIKDIVSTCNPDQYKAIIAAGGDGTIYSVINALAGSSLPLGVIPTGSINIFAQSLSIPTDIKDACETILKQRPITIDLGKINNHYFACMAGLGFDAEIIRKTSSEFKKKWGLFSYVFQALSLSFKYNYPKITLTLNKENTLYTAYYVVICNAPLYAGSFSISTDISMTDSQLHLCFLAKKGLRYYLFFLLFLLTNSKTSNSQNLIQSLKNKLNKISQKQSEVSIIPFQTLSIIHNEFKGFHLDAEYLNEELTSVKIVPSSLRVLV